MIKTRQIKRQTEKYTPPEGYRSVPVLSWQPKYTKYFELSPYHLRTDGKEEHVNPGNVLFENFWQGSKVYPIVYPITVNPHWTQKDKVLWSRGQETHYTTKDSSRGTIHPAYYKWRQELWDCPHAIRYPNGRKYRATCAFLLLSHKTKEERLGYLESRKRVYVQEYKRLVRKLPIYEMLLEALRKGENLCIQEIDVPCQSKKGAYNQVNADGTFDVTLEKLEVLKHDTSEAYGHGLCLAETLLEDQ